MLQEQHCFYFSLEMFINQNLFQKINWLANLEDVPEVFVNQATNETKSRRMTKHFYTYKKETG